MATTSKSMCSEQDNSDNTIMQLCMLIKKNNSVRFNSERKITPFACGIFGQEHLVVMFCKPAGTVSENKHYNSE